MFGLIFFFLAVAFASIRLRPWAARRLFEAEDERDQLLRDRKLLKKVWHLEGHTNVPENAVGLSSLVWVAVVAGVFRAALARFS